MASTTYTKRFWTLNSPSVGFNAGPSVPVGKVWVVRDVILIPLVGITNLTVNGGELFAASNTIVLANVSSAECINQRVYHWEMRQVLNAGEDMQFFAGERGWHLSVSGYEFTSP